MDRGKQADGSKSDTLSMRSLKGKVARLIGVVTLVFLVVYLAIFYLYQQPSLLKQEDMFARKTVLQIRGVLERALQDLVSLNEDWSNWDAMYRAVDVWTPEFEAEAFPQEVFESLGIDYAGVFNENHEPIFSRWLIESPDGSALMSGTPGAEIEAVLFKRKDHIAKGIFPTEFGPVFISSKPIFRSDSTGPERGFLVMGRRIKHRMIKGIGETVREKVSMVHLDRIKLGGTSHAGIQMERTGMKLVLVFPVKDYFHHDILALRVEVERSLFQVLYRSTVVSMGLLLVAVLVMVVVVSMGIERIVLRRILETANSIHESTIGKLNLKRLHEDGDDEITLLQRSFNRLIRRIDHEEQVRRQAEQEMRQIEKLAMAGRVTGNILHEINNPIRVIKNCLFAIDKKPENLTETLALLKSEVKQLGNITNELLDFAGGSMNIEVRKIDLNSIIRETVMSISTAFPEGNYEILVPGAGCQASVNGDRNRLKQVFFNVVKNGLEAMNFGGHITIHVERDPEPGMLAVCILDDGPGVDPDSINHLFEPFYTRHKESGVGLGLSISYDIMKRHGGDICLDSTEGDGACFRIRIPGELEDAGNEV